jgi:membrane fusion protein (multidrug efflux system)
MKETQIGDIRPGDPAEITIEAFPGLKLEGRVESVAGGTGSRFSLLPPDNASGNFVKVVQRVPVRIAWTNPPAVPLMAGLSAEVTVSTGTHADQPVASRQP